MSEIHQSPIVIDNSQLKKAKALTMPKLLEQVQNLLRTRHYSIAPSKLTWFAKWKVLTKISSIEEGAVQAMCFGKLFFSY